MACLAPILRAFSPGQVRQLLQIWRPKPSKLDRAAIKRERRSLVCHKTAIITLIVGPWLDGEGTCMHRLISIKNVAGLPKMPSTAVNHRAAGEIRLSLASTRSGK